MAGNKPRVEVKNCSVWTSCHFASCLSFSPPNTKKNRVVLACRRLKGSKYHFPSIDLVLILKLQRYCRSSDIGIQVSPFPTLQNILFTFLSRNEFQIVDAISLWGQYHKTGSCCCPLQHWQPSTLCNLCSLKKKLCPRIYRPIYYILSKTPFRASHPLSMQPWRKVLCVQRDIWYGNCGPHFLLTMECSSFPIMM
jgi:hypothetical protein